MGDALTGHKNLKITNVHQQPSLKIFEIFKQCSAQAIPRKRCSESKMSAAFSFAYREKKTALNDS